MPNERRNLTALGRKRRREFDRSIRRLRELGMPDWAVEYYRRASRIAGLPPHMVVCHVAVVAAGRQMQANIAAAHAADGPQAERESILEDPAGTTSQAAPSYDAVQAMRRRVTGLWLEIQRHGTMLEAARGAAGENPTAEDLAPGTVTPLRARATAPARTATRPRRR